MVYIYICISSSIYGNVEILVLQEWYTTNPIGWVCASPFGRREAIPDDETSALLRLFHIDAFR